MKIYLQVVPEEKAEELRRLRRALDDAKLAYGNAADRFRASLRDQWPDDYWKGKFTEDHSHVVFLREEKK